MILLKYNIENINECVIDLEKVEQNCINICNSLVTPKRYLENSDQFISTSRLIEKWYVKIDQLEEDNNE